MFLRPNHYWQGTTKIHFFLSIGMVTKYCGAVLKKKRNRLCNVKTVERVFRFNIFDRGISYGGCIPRLFDAVEAIKRRGGVILERASFRRQRRADVGAAFTCHEHGLWSVRVSGANGVILAKETADSLNVNSDSFLFKYIILFFAK